MPDLISDCCYEDYKDKKRENQERLMEERLESADKKKKNLSFQVNNFNFLMQKSENSKN